MTFYIFHICSQKTAVESILSARLFPALKFSFSFNAMVESPSWKPSLVTKARLFESNNDDLIIPVLYGNFFSFLAFDEFRPPA